MKKKIIKIIMCFTLMTFTFSATNAMSSKLTKENKTEVENEKNFLTEKRSKSEEKLKDKIKELNIKLRKERNAKNKLILEKYSKKIKSALNSINNDYKLITGENNKMDENIIKQVKTRMSKRKLDTLSQKNCKKMLSKVLADKMLEKLRKSIDKENKHIYTKNFKNTEKNKFMLSGEDVLNYVKDQINLNKSNIDKKIEEKDITEFMANKNNLDKLSIKEQDQNITYGDILKTKDIPEFKANKNNLDKLNIENREENATFRDMLGYMPNRLSAKIQEENTKDEDMLEERDIPENIINENIVNENIINENIVNENVTNELDTEKQKEIKMYEDVSKANNMLEYIMSGKRNLDKLINVLNIIKRKVKETTKKENINEKDVKEYLNNQHKLNTGNNINVNKGVKPTDNSLIMHCLHNFITYRKAILADKSLSREQKINIQKDLIFQLFENPIEKEIIPTFIVLPTFSASLVSEIQEFEDFTSNLLEKAAKNYKINRKDVSDAIKFLTTEFKKRKKETIKNNRRKDTDVKNDPLFKKYEKIKNILEALQSTKIEDIMKDMENTNIVSML